jgi:hypothetical protein
MPFVAMLVAAIAWAAPAQGYANWPGYLFDPGHSSFNGGAGAITPSRVPLLSAAWSAAFNPGTTFWGSPTVYNGSVYIGGLNGVFYQLSETTGALLHSVNTGMETVCGSNGRLGISSTATVAPDPSRAGAPTVYVTGGNVAGGNGGIYLYALDAATLQPVWSVDPVLVDKQPGANAWSSPTVSGGQISVGISSGCDLPLVRGGLAVFRQADGSSIGTYYTMPAGSVGAGIWSSAAASGTTAWATTGNASESPGSAQGDAYSILRFNGASKVDGWTVPNLIGTDSDFGASPTLFTGSVGGVSTPMVGACNKNGVFYALQSNSLSAGPVWTFRIGGKDSSEPTACISAAVWDAAGRQLIIGGNHTLAAIDGFQWPGSIRALAPDANVSNRVLWDMGLPCPVQGTPTENGAGVVAVVTWNDSCMSGSSPAVYLINAHVTTPNPLGNPSPVVLKVIQLSSGGFSQPTFADGYLFVAGVSGGLMAYH